MRRKAFPKAFSRASGATEPVSVAAGGARGGLSGIYCQIAELQCTRDVSLKQERWPGAVPGGMVTQL